MPATAMRVLLFGMVQRAAAHGMYAH
jgi:hypothetical protein